MLCLGIGLSALPGCKDDEPGVTEECVAPELAINIIGEWNKDDDIVEFKSDGSISDPQGHIIDPEIIGATLPEKTYEVTSDSTLNITSSSTDLTQSSTQEVTVPQSECNLLRLSFQGNYSLLLTR